MNFVDAAVTLLREVNGPLHVEELCRLALERGLLDSPGQSPLRSLKGRLTTELKRGPDSRVVRVEDDLWALADAGRNGEEEIEEEVTAPEIEPVTAPPGFGAEAGPGATDAYEDALAGELADEDDEEEDDEDDDEEEDDDEGDDDLAVAEEDLAADDEDDDDDGYEDDDEDDDEVVDQSPGKAAGGEGEHVDQGEDVDEGEDVFIDVDMDEEEGGAAAEGFEEEDTQVRERAAQAEQARALERDDLSSEEKELIQSFGGESGTAQVGALVEYRDSQTADEDRPMVPEMLPERRGRQREDWKARRERMREKRRERREGREGRKAAREQGAPAAEAGEGRAAAPERAPDAAEVEARPVAPVGDGDLARRACEVLASIKGAQPVPVRQLAQMMRKRRLVDVDPEQLWRPLKSALLADHQRRAAAGLPPRVAYRGRDLFAYRPSANAELEAAETGLEAAAHRLRGATERALAARLVELALPVLEQVVQLYLVQTGWRDVEWIKRVDRSGYAVAREPGDGQQIMIAARAGNQEVDRRGVGELRAGVAAKNMSRGLLLAPRELGAEARAEIERPGKPVGAMCGLPWAGALVDAGIGVALRMMPVAYLEAELFDRLSEG